MADAVKDPRQEYIDFCARELAANGPDTALAQYIYAYRGEQPEDVTALVIAAAAVITGG